MKTLQDCKDEVARLKYHGYKNWDDMSSELILRNHEGAKELLDRLEQAAELYAKAYHEDSNNANTLLGTVIPQSKEELLDCIQNLMGVFDTPIGRLRMKGEFADEVRKIGRGRSNYQI